MRRVISPLLIVLFAACSEPSTSPSTGQPALRPGPTDPTATWLIPLDDAGLALRSDGNATYSVGTNSVYANGVCGLSTRIFATTGGSNSGDATLQTGKSKNCSRQFILRYPDAVTEAVLSFNNLNILQNTGYSIPIGTTVKRRLIVAPGAIQNNPSRCGRVLFGPNGAVSPGSDSLNVTRIDTQTWHVQSHPDSNLAYCEDTGELYAMPVSFVIVSSAPLP
jgi:hypothetical protein